jgi:uncharacterized OsmC-like protein
LASITLDTDMGGNPHAFNPAELLLAALLPADQGHRARSTILKFELRGVQVIVDGVRQMRHLQNGEHPIRNRCGHR